LARQEWLTGRSPCADERRERYLSAWILVIAIADDPAAGGGLMDEHDVLAERFDAERVASSLLFPSVLMTLLRITRP
jgi:hypothetical protein